MLFYTSLNKNVKLDEANYNEERIRKFNSLYISDM